MTDQKEGEKESESKAAATDKENMPLDPQDSKLSESGSFVDLSDDTINANEK